MFVYVAHNITTITTVATDEYGKTSHIIGTGLTKNIKKYIYRHPSANAFFVAAQNPRYVKFALRES